MSDYCWQFNILRFSVDIKFLDFVCHTENLNSTNQNIACDKFR